MPVSSLSGALSTAVYFASMFLLLGILIPPVKTVYEDADMAAARHIAEGIAGQIDALSPGMSSVVWFASVPGSSASVVLSGGSVTATVGGESASEPVRWGLPGVSLSTDLDYEVTLNGGALEVA
jgi:hypothetical protein